MKKYTIILLLLLLMLSCGKKQQSVSENISLSETKDVQSEKDTTPVRFQFAAKWLDKKEGIVSVYDATLYNDRNDTVYFVIESCNGYEPYLHVKYHHLDDSQNLHVLYSSRTCTIYKPVIKHIAPKDSLSFEVERKGFFKNKPICIGFNFYEVDDNTNMDTIDLYKTREEGKIIWHETMIE
jgi:hypothetical protein